jgi:uncharacterized protein (DUF488 family)
MGRRKNMREVIKCIIPIRFQLKPNANGVCFTKESLNNIEEDFKNAPIINIKNGNAIGVFSDSFQKFENDKEITFLVDGNLFTECYPEIIIKDANYVGDKKVIENFKFTGLSI